MICYLHTLTFSFINKQRNIHIRWKLAVHHKFWRIALHQWHQSLSWLPLPRTTLRRFFAPQKIARGKPCFASGGGSAIHLCNHLTSIKNLTLTSFFDWFGNNQSDMLLDSIKSKRLHSNLDFGFRIEDRQTLKQNFKQIFINFSATTAWMWLPDYANSTPFYKHRLGVDIFLVWEILYTKWWSVNRNTVQEQECTFGVSVAPPRLPPPTCAISIIHFHHDWANKKLDADIMDNSFLSRLVDGTWWRRRLLQYTKLLTTSDFCLATANIWSGHSLKVLCEIGVSTANELPIASSQAAAFLYGLLCGIQL